MLLPEISSFYEVQIERSSRILSKNWTVFSKTGWKFSFLFYGYWFVKFMEKGESLQDDALLSVHMRCLVSKKKTLIFYFHGVQEYNLISWVYTMRLTSFKTAVVRYQKKIIKMFSTHYLFEGGLYETRFNKIFQRFSCVRKFPFLKYRLTALLQPLALLY